MENFKKSFCFVYTSLTLALIFVSWLLVMGLWVNIYCEVISILLKGQDLITFNFAYGLGLLLLGYCMVRIAAVSTRFYFFSLSYYLYKVAKKFQSYRWLETFLERCDDMLA